MNRDYSSDQTLIDRLLVDDTSAFEELHRRYCFSLYSYCLGKLNSAEESRNIVRDIFIWLWENRHTLPVSFSISSHLYTEVRKAVVQSLNNQLNKVETKDDVERQFFPGFSINELKKARQPITGSTKTFIVQGDRKMTDIPKWNQYPVDINSEKLKKILRDFLNCW